jgi:hypothetical protein
MQWVSYRYAVAAVLMYRALGLNYADIHSLTRLDCVTIHEICTRAAQLGG